MNLKHVKKMHAKSEALTKFVEGHKELLEEKIVTEVVSLNGRLTAIVDTQQGARVAIAQSRTRRDEALDNLRKVVVEAKRSIELAGVRDRKPVVLPRLNNGLWMPSEILRLAHSYLKALEAAGSDPNVDKATATLKAAIDGYQASLNDTTQGLIDRRKFHRGLAEEARELTVKLDGYVSFVACPTQPPALPAIPTDNTVLRRDGVTAPSPATAIPPSSEHPIQSANA